MLKKCVEVCAEDIDKLGEPDAVHAISKDDVLAVTHSKTKRGWGIGSKGKNNEWGMHYGPCLTLQQCLKTNGNTGHYIIHFIDDHNHIVKYSWCDGRWKPMILPNTNLL